MKNKTMKTNMFKKSKLLTICVLSILSVLIVFSFTRNSSTEGSELSSLNSKYRLASVESLDYNDTSSSNLSYFFSPDVLSANILDTSSPEVEVIVKLKGKSDPSSFAGVFLLKLKTDADPIEIAKQYESINIISYAEPNFAVELSDDEEVNLLRPNRKTNLSIKSKDSSDIVVAVIDSGVDTTHKDLKDRIIEGYDFVLNTDDVSDSYGHGTHVAGIIESNSSAKIMPIRFTDGKKGKISDLSKAIKFAVDHDADVINLSLGLQQPSFLLENAINYASKKNVPVVAAAGNYNTSNEYYPAAYDDVIAVTGLAKDGRKLPQSNFGTWVDYSVIAQDIYSTMPNDKYGYATGTSQAAPFVSAKIAEILKNAREEVTSDVLIELNKISIPLSASEEDLYLGKELG